MTAPFDLRDDQGLTLVELLIASFLTVGVVTIAGWMLVSSLVGGQEVAAAGTANSQAQLLADQVADAVRSADGATLALETLPAGGQLLRVTEGTFDSTGAATAWACRAFAITADGRAYTARAATAIAAPTGPADFDGWRLIASGLTPAASAAAILELDGSTVEVAAESAPGTRGALIRTSVTARPLPSEPVISC